MCPCAGSEIVNIGRIYLFKYIEKRQTNFGVA